MAKLSFTIEDRGDQVHIHLEQDLPFDTPLNATNAERMAMFLLKFVEKQDQKARDRFENTPKSKLILPPMGWTPINVRGRHK